MALQPIFTDGSGMGTSKFDRERGNGGIREIAHHLRKCPEVIDSLWGQRVKEQGR